MELKHLRTFVAVAEEEHFGRAARRLHLAQPAVSKQIKDLELTLEVSLFERLARGVRLTAAGRRLLEDARRLLADAETAREGARRVARGELGSLTIGYNETVSWAGIIPETVRAFRTRHPEVALTMLPFTSVQQVAELHDDRIDAGFLFNRSPEDEVLTGIPVLVDNLRLAVLDSSSWARHPPRRLSDLAGQDFIWMPRRVSPLHYDRVLQQCRRGGLELRVVQEAMNESAMLSLVAVGMGATFVPASAEARKPAAVVLVPVPDLTLTVTMELVWRVDDRSPTLAAFTEVTKQQSAGLERQPQRRKRNS